MNNKALSYLKLTVLMVILVGFDQLTKYWATITLKNNSDIVIIKDVLHLHYLDGGNTGAAWGMFSGSIVFFIVFTLIAILLLFRIIVNINNNYSLKKSAVVLKYVLASLIAGAIGNLIDRIVHNFVIDFIYFKLIDFPIFNVADCYVTISCILVAIISVFFLTEDEFGGIFSLKFKKDKEHDK